MITLVMTLIGDNPKEIERFERFIREYEQRAYYRAFSFLKNKQDAEDVVQDAFLIAAVNFNNIRDIDSKDTRNYIMTIVENRARRILAVNDRRRETEAAMIDNCKVVHSVQQNDDAYSDIEIAELIATMPQAYSAPMYMFYIQRASIKEIAMELGIKETAVRKRLERARSMLKKILGD